MRFFFDNNISPHLVDILKILGVDALHLRDVFPTNAKDTEWIPRVGQEGWVLVTADKNILRNRAERDALREHRLTTLVLKETILHKGMWEQTEWFIKHWQEIGKDALRLNQGTCVIVRENGKFDKLP